MRGAFLICRSLFVIAARRAAAIVALAAVGALPISALAADVDVSLSPRAGTIEDVFTLSVTVRGSEKRQVSAPEFGDSQIVTLENIGRGVRTIFANGVPSFEVSFRFQMSPSPNLRPGTYALPKGTIVVDGRRIEIEAQRFVILAPDQAAKERSRARATGVDFTHTVDNLQPYVGQQVLYKAQVAGGPSLIGGKLDDVEFRGFWREPLGDAGEQKRAVGDVTIHTFAESLFPVTPGKAEIPARALRAKTRIRSGRRTPYRSLFEELMVPGFEELRAEESRLVTPALELNVRDLPPPPQGAPSNIPVGAVSIQSGVDRGSVPLGESVTLTIVLEGDANLRPLEIPQPSRQSAADYKSYEDKPKVDVTPSFQGVSMKKTFTIALVPLKPGTFELPRYRFLVFDPKDEQYRWLESEEGRITVRPAEGSERLVVRGAEPKPGQTAQPQIPAVDDIRPQQVGPRALARPFLLPAPLRIAVLILIPLLAAAFEIVDRRRKRLQSPDPSRAARGRLVAVLGRDGTGAGEILSAFESYVQQRFALPGPLDPSALGAKILVLPNGPDLAARTEDVIRRLQKLVYGGGGAPQELVQLKSDLATIVEAFDAQP